MDGLIALQIQPCQTTLQRSCLAHGGRPAVQDEALRQYRRGEAAHVGLNDKEGLHLHTCGGCKASASACPPRDRMPAFTDALVAFAGAEAGCAAGCVCAA